jgi:hypothetical protein
MWQFLRYMGSEASDRIEQEYTSFASRGRNIFSGAMMKREFSKTQRYHM